MIASSNDEKRTRSKAVKVNTGQRTLLDMFGKKKQLDSQETESSSSGGQVVNESQDDESAIPPDSPDTAIDSIDTTPTTPTTPKPKASEIPIIGPDTAFIEFSDSDDELDDALLSEDKLPGTQHAPIFIDSSPIKTIIEETELEVKKTKKTIHPFFAARAQLDNSTTSPTSSGRVHTNELEAAYPDRESQHVKGIQTSYGSPPCPFVARRHANGTGGNTRTRDSLAVLDFLLPCEGGEDRDPCDDDGIISRITEREKYLGRIDQSLIRKHPAIERVVEAARSGGQTKSSSGQLWMDVWRPRCAKEVLGNEGCAIYLRNWLHTLGLQLKGEDMGDKKKKKKKRRKRDRVVIREVPRKKARRDGLEGFLVEDGDDDDELEEEDDVDPKEWEEAELQGGSEERSIFGSDVAEVMNGKLHNTILLSGPSGCGKTAAVYACAEELGWEVFEVYPGIGRRNGANVDNLVGEVGKNHLVRRGKEEEGGVRQSVILLEEVDLLFDEDVNFWTGVSKLIRECRRPVICTCNDTSLVPMDELPLQKVLRFQGVCKEVGTAYLQGVACVEGYEGKVEYDDDLREGMNKIQMECQTGRVLKNEKEEEEEEEESYRAVVKRIGWSSGRESDWTERVAVLRGMGRFMLSLSERTSRRSVVGLVRVGRRELGAACSGMEVATWGGRVVG